VIARVAVLIVAHAPLASALRACAEHVYACAPEALAALAVIDVAANAEHQAEVARALVSVAAIERGRGVLVLTDLFGASPANIASQLAKPGEIEVVTGVNLPMLLGALCYCDQLSVTALAEKAQTGGSSGVMKLAATPPQNQRLARATDVTQKDDHAATRLQDQQ
jgi:PTS system ascorbate-specific IIA component